MSQTTAVSKTSLSQPAWLTLLRIVLGLILIWKAINFIRDISALESQIKQIGIGIFTQNGNALALVVTMLTLLCGLFITVGLFTRLASAIQIPVVLVAILFANIKNIDRNTFELLLTIVALVLLILFTIKGSGAFSADEYFRKGAAIDKTSDSVFL
jgi:uncharacterized membrane protein YphA (DoxX/SURF4 family)